MKRVMMATVALASTLFMQPIDAQALGVNVGPFSFSVGGGVRVGTPFFQFYNDPICRAIQNHDLIALYVQSGDEVQRVIIEPYALGYNKDGNLILQGYQVEAFLVSDEETVDGDGQGVVGGVFTTIKGDNWTDLSIDRVVRIEVMQNTDFVVREDAFNNIKESDKIVDMICSIYP